MKPLVIILMGSSSDMDHAEKIASELKSFGIEYAIRIGSAHKTAEHVISMLLLQEEVMLFQALWTVL